MSLWTCGVAGCNARFEDAESAVVHQTNDHERTECKVCGAIVPEGYFAIRHAFDEHSRAEYIRAYNADSAAVRMREGIQAAIEEEADLQRIIEQVDAGGRAESEADTE
ncbi:DUF7565 family protein [Haloprofundus salinisoli]|uniref:DUF7565 family protein n=1 Tax=Haloprofundus salinisoli TaxID=2876193 RepID=UPI001CCB3E8A|nr:hypothetical protein [Haloprofundus salinisoli]